MARILRLKSLPGSGIEYSNVRNKKITPPAPAFVVLMILSGMIWLYEIPVYLGKNRLEF